MPAYWIARSRLTAAPGPEFEQDMGRYARYFEGVREHYGRRTLARGIDAVTIEGEQREGHWFVHEFPSLELARALYEAPEYQEVAQLRKKHSETDIVLLDGVDTGTA